MERAFGVCARASRDEVADPGRDPLTRPAPADEDAVARHPLPQRGEGWAFTLPLLGLPEVRCWNSYSSNQAAARDGDVEGRR
jgi:hypothetical protein